MITIITMDAKENNKTAIDGIIQATFDYLKQLYKNEKSDNLRIIFPRKSSHGQNKRGDIRVSEQELRFAFVEQFLKNIESKGWHYSVETPTEFYYKSARNGNEPALGGSRSGKIDLTLYDESINPIAFFEFKSGSLSPNDNSGKFKRELKYDIIKLIVESCKCDCLGYSLHIYGKSNHEITNFSDYIDEAVKIIQKTKDDSKEKIDEDTEKRIVDKQTLSNNIQYKPIAICE